MNIQQHPDPESLHRFANGDVPEEDFAEIAAHLDECDSCLRIVTEAPGDSLHERIVSAANQGTRVDRLSDATPANSSFEVANVVPMRKRARANKESNDDEVPEELATHPKYKILRHLGTGGMGSVFLAKHRLMDRTVALKLIRSSILDNPRALERFQKEVRVVSRLSHPNIVSALDAEQVGDTHFLVMEYVRGTDLNRFIQLKGPLTVLQSCHFAMQIAKGLQHAHEKGLVHRDIKPRNLMLLEQGQIKILDFGLATLRERDEADDLDLTHHGAVLGTPDYISPEQATNARDVDIRADIYSLGCTLYFFLTGNAPFQFESTAEKLGAHLHLPPPDVQAERPEVGPELSEYIQRMMAKDRSERPAEPSDVAEALGNFFRTHKKASRNQKQVHPVVIPSSGAVPLVLPNEAAAGNKDESLAEHVPETLAENGITEFQELPAPAMSVAAVPDGDIDGAAAVAAESPTVDTLIAEQPTYDSIGSTESFSQPHATKAKRNRYPFPVMIAGAAALGLLLIVSIIGIAFGSGLFGDNDSEGSDGLLGGSSTNTERFLIAVPFESYWEHDLTHIVEQLDAAGFRYDFVSSQTGQATAHPNSIVRGWVDIEHKLGDINPDDYDGVIFIGAYPEDKVEFIQGAAGGESAKRVIDKMLADDKFVIGLCGGIAPLISSGALDHRLSAYNQYLPESLENRAEVRWDFQSHVVRAAEGQRVFTASRDIDSAELVQQIQNEVNR